MASLARLKKADKKLQEAILTLKEDILDIPYVVLQLVECRQRVRSEVSWEEHQKKSKANLDELSGFLSGLLDSSATKKFKLPIGMGTQPIKREFGNTEKPKSYEDCPDYMFADEMNYRLPLNTLDRTQAAKQNWSVATNKNLYTEREQNYISARIDVALDYFKSKGRIVEDFGFEDIYRK